MSKLFNAHWPQTKAMLCEGRDLEVTAYGAKSTTKKAMMATVLENTKRVLTEQATFGASNAASIAAINKVILPVIRRVMPTVIANEIIGVQPMSGPIAQIHTLRVRYADTYPTDGSGVTAGNEALSPFDIAKFYSGNGSVSNPAGASTAALEGAGGKRLSIQILRETVEAKSRKLSARWTYEAAQDASSQQGIDIEAEILSALANEITSEIDQEILNSLIQLPGTPTAIFKQDAVTGTPTFIGDVHAALAILINRQANLIAQRTRRGAANWIVVSPTALTILQSAETSAFARTTEGTFESPTNTKYVGTLNSSLRVYVNAYASDNTPVLVGLKNNETDAAAYFCPYIPLMSSGILTDPNTFEPVVSFMTRYGYLELVNSAASFGNSADYVSLVGIDTTSLSFI